MSSPLACERRGPRPLWVRSRLSSQDASTSRFTHKSGHAQSRPQCRLSANSGHEKTLNTRIGKQWQARGPLRCLNLADEFKKSAGELEFSIRRIDPRNGRQP